MINCLATTSSKVKLKVELEKVVFEANPHCRGIA